MIATNFVVFLGISMKRGVLKDISLSNTLLRAYELGFSVNMPLFDAIGGMLFLFLSLLAYILLGVAIIGGTFLVTALGTGLLIAAPGLIIVQRAPTVRRGFFFLTDTFFGHSPSNLKDRVFLTVYIGAVGLYSIGCLIVIAQILTAIDSSALSYPPYQPVMLAFLGVFLVGLFVVVRSGRLRQFGPRTQLFLEWSAFTACVTVLGSVVVFEMLLLVLDVLYIFI